MTRSTNYIVSTHTLIDQELTLVEIEQWCSIIVQLGTWRLNMDRRHSKLYVAKNGNVPFHSLGHEIEQVRSRSLFDMLHFYPQIYIFRTFL